MAAADRYLKIVTQEHLTVNIGTMVETIDLERNMKKELVKIAGIILAAAFFLPGAASRAAGTPGNENIRIGLTYGSNAAAGANLLNEVGAGYRMGYYDSDLVFHTLAFTREKLISVVKTQNVYYFPKLSNGYQGYTDSGESSVGVGCFHIQLPGSYENYDAAAAAAGNIKDGFPAWSEGTYYVRSGAYLSGDAARNALAEIGVEGAAVVGTSSYGVSVVKTGTATILFQFDGGAERALGILPGQDGSEQTETWYLGSKYFGGFRFERINGGNLTVVNILGLEDYVNCVISREMSDSWPVEALKAQACCARTYAARLNRHASHHFDLCSTTDCQAYPGCGQIGANTTQAARETAGMYVWYGTALAETYYFSSDGGATEDVKNVWVADLPYLKGKADPYEALAADQIYQYTWSYTFGEAELETVAQRLRANGRPCGKILEMYVSAVTAQGNVRSITFKDDNGKSWTVYGGDARNFLGVRSQRFTVYGGGSFFVDGMENTLNGMNGVSVIDGDGTVQTLDSLGGMPYVITGEGTEQLYEDSDSYTVVGSGWGHNVGMSQWGAYAMAKQGYTYQDILKFYYTGVDIH